MFTGLGDLTDILGNAVALVFLFVSVCFAAIAFLRSVQVSVFALW